MDKLATFLDNNHMWFSWTTMITLLGVAVWLIQSMASLSNTLDIISVNLENLAAKTSDRAIYVDGRVNDHEVRIRELERSKMQ